MKTKDDSLTIRTTNDLKKRIDNLVMKFFKHGKKSALIEYSVDTLERLSALADKHTKGSIEVLLFKIEEMLEGKK